MILSQGNEGKNIQTRPEGSTQSICRDADSGADWLLVAASQNLAIVGGKFNLGIPYFNKPQAPLVSTCNHVPCQHHRHDPLADAKQLTAGLWL
jgi:hypothetical protein